MRSFYFISTFVAIFSLTVESYGDSLSAGEVYGKCYEKLTGFPIDIDSNDFQKVKKGQLNPVSACMSVLNQSLFQKSGNNRTLPNTTSDLQRSILRNFHQFHMSWFSNSLGSPHGILSFAYIDNDEPGLYVTDALFSDKHFKTIVTANEALRGIRTTANPNPYYVFRTNMSNLTLVVAPLASGDILQNYVEINASRVPAGPLIGITRAPNLQVRLPTTVARPTLTEAQLTSRLYEGTSVNLAQHFGGGVLGSSPYLMNNLESTAKGDGGLYSHRRWASSFFTDIMCSRLPSLLESDSPVVAEANRYKNSTLTFRSSATCLTCHTTLDNFSGVTRNIDFLQSASNGNLDLLRQGLNNTRIQRVMLPVEFGQRSPSSTAVMDSDNLYIRRPPTGKLIYRNYDGKLINQTSVNGIADMGEKVAAQDDMYVCAAKKYYQFLTGIDVSLDPPSASDKFGSYHRKQVVDLGLSLKSHGSLKRLIQNILESEAFQAVNPSQVGE